MQVSMHLLLLPSEAILFGRMLPSTHVAQLCAA